MKIDLPEMILVPALSKTDLGHQAKMTPINIGKYVFSIDFFPEISGVNLPTMGRISLPVEVDCPDVPSLVRVSPFPSKALNVELNFLSDFADGSSDLTTFVVYKYNNEFHNGS